MLLHHLAPYGVWWGDTNGCPEFTVQGRSSDIPLLIVRNFMGDSVAVFFVLVFFRDSFFLRISYGLQVAEQFQISKVNPFKDWGSV